MFRALIELLFTIIIIVAARAVLTSLMRGIANASSGAFQKRQNSGAGDNGRAASHSGSNAGSELHKDPVCGTYVAESTPFRRQIGSQAFYYCSDACREKHALVAR